MKGRLHPVLLPFLFVATVTALPYVLTELRPPVGTRFVGVFYYGDDFYNYLSYAEQAERGAFLLRNKVLLDDHPPAMVNLEWWVVGRLSALVGGRLILAYRIFAVIAALGFLLAADAVLRRLGLPDSHRMPALMLVATGGGLGGILFEFTPRSMNECLDLYAGLFPFLGLLANPHFVAGTALLLLGLVCYLDATASSRFLLATLAATGLALVRPYDFVLLVAAYGISVAWLDAPSRWPGRLLPLIGLLPVVAYLYWLFYVNPAFAFYARAPYGFPSLRAFAWALVPAILLALPAALARPAEATARRMHTLLLAWAALGLVVIALRPVRFSLQFMAGIGFPFLALGALGLARLRPAFTLAAALLFSTSFVAALAYVQRPSALWLTPSANLEIAEALRDACRAGDIAFTPPEVGVFTYGLTACRAYVSHPVAPDYERRLAEVARFGHATPEERRLMLDERRIRHLVLPGDAGPAPTAWLGPATTFRRRHVTGSASPLSLYSRDDAPPASAAPTEPATIP